MSRELERLFRPRTIAVIGGGAWCAQVIEQCQKIGYRGRIWPVHPTLPSVCGLPAFTSVDALPAAPDAVFVGINRHATVEVVAALSARGAGGAICFASGFAEAAAESNDGADMQGKLLSAAGDMPIIGPNCYGYLNYLDRTILWPDQHGGVSCDTGVALVTQSSNIAINLTMQTRGLPIAYVVTVGNQAQTGLAEIGAALLDDERVTALGLHIEGVGDLRALEALAAKAHTLGKPIVALKVGQSDHARTAAISHTASLAGSDVGARALLARLGIGQVSSLPALLETLKLLHTVGPLRSNRVASMSCSGGEASLVADSAHGRNVSFPALTPAQIKALRTALGPMVALANPLDYHTYIWGNLQAMTDTFTAMMRADLGFGMVVLDFPRSDRCTSPAWGLVIDAVERARDVSGVPMGIVSSLPETMPEATAHRLLATGIVPLCGLDHAIDAIEVAAAFGGNPDTPAPIFLAPPQSRGVLTERAAKRALAAHGVRVPQSRPAVSPEEAARAAAEIGFPVVLKGEGHAHKSEAGAVRLNLTSAAHVVEAARAMQSESFLVEEMITGGIVELLIGVTRDPAHGYVLTLAAGGVLTEILQDSQSLLVPSTREEIHAALMRLRIAPLLRGYRGAPAADIKAVLDNVMAVQAHVMAAPADEVEINPLIVMPDGAIAADALIRTGDI
ncbi:Acyl-CoA synthetase (NDP forming) [Aliiroseovarius sediminilitoris]|uniref:Acyl-CoA synthetase (NDP forming) n=1 Tax=Aliiroseovarius sediminilitoris TaxID=1173584 RepID=A0A1I0PGT6_9RHOB|nr:acetate--CoA ligase family protein [Aliiroseovarius sediminilitoris]SEW12899.1 Acyl-CoA synthetase (NDP forming) [Aliiroseovarius sediminilitoris]